MTIMLRLPRTVPDTHTDIRDPHLHELGSGSRHAVGRLICSVSEGSPL